MSKNIISDDRCVVQKIGLDSTDMDGETVMMDVERGKYYCFNSVGSSIWRLIENPMKVNQIKSVLMEEFEVDEKTCEEEILGFLNRLHNEELISII